VIVLQVLRGDHEQPWTCAELERELHDIDPDAIAVALQRLHEQGVVHTEDDQIEASPCARHLDALAFICI
jgi:DNA-binding HxlR family transcriptional regulator